MRQRIGVGRRSTRRGGQAHPTNSSCKTPWSQLVRGQALLEFLAIVVTIVAAIIAFTSTGVVDESVGTKGEAKSLMGLVRGSLVWVETSHSNPTKTADDVLGL